MPKPISNTLMPVPGTDKIHQRRRYMLSGDLRQSCFHSTCLSFLCPFILRGRGAVQLTIISLAVAERIRRQYGIILVKWCSGEERREEVGARIGKVGAKDCCKQKSKVAPFSTVLAKLPSVRYSKPDHCNISNYLQQSRLRCQQSISKDIERQTWPREIFLKKKV